MTIKILNVKADIANLRPCPYCRQPGGWPAGYVDTPVNTGAQVYHRNGPFMPFCPVCKGRQFVDLDNVCCCGKAAVSFKEKIWSCGREGCHSYLKNHANTPPRSNERIGGAPFTDAELAQWDMYNNHCGVDC